MFYFNSISSTSRLKDRWHIPEKRLEEPVELIISRLKSSAIDCRIGALYSPDYCPTCRFFAQYCNRLFHDW